MVPHRCGAHTACHRLQARVLLFVNCIKLTHRLVGCLIKAPPPPLIDWPAERIALLLFLGVDPPKRLKTPSHREAFEKDPDNTR